MIVFLIHIVILILITYFQKEIACKRFYEFFNIDKDMSIREKKQNIIDSAPLFILYSVFIIFMPVIGILFYLGFLHYEKIINSFLYFCEKGDCNDK